MTKALPAVLLLALAMLPPASPSVLAATSSATAPAASRTAPPIIYHVITRPLCSNLHRYFAPAVGMIRQNDAEIGKGPDLFKRYNQAGLEGVDNSTSNSAPSGAGASGPLGEDPGTMTPSQNMALLGMENLIGPIANNAIAIQTMLDKPELQQSTGNAEDDKRQAEMRSQLLKALAAQQASLDIVSGFVDTQQMADLQHSGESYIGAINQPDTTRTIQGTPTPFPGTYDPNQAGIGANPYSIDLTTVPGLTLGYNPVVRLLEGLHWTIDQTEKRENDAAKSILESAASCGNIPGTPAPH